MVRSRITFVVVVSILCGICSCLAPAYAADNGDDDVNIGKKAADQIAKDKVTKFITDKAIVGRVETIGKAIADVARVKEVPATYGTSTPMKFDYTFKVIDDKEVNAFSLPGGFVYVNKGLIDSVQSDDELAAVIAHEIGHIAHRHGMQMMKAQEKQMLGVGIAVLASAALGAKGDSMAGLAYIGNLISLAKSSEYGQKAEFDADRTAVDFLIGTKYNPVGMLTFMEQLSRKDLRSPQITYGIFATHPASRLRSNEIIDELGKNNITINRRLVTNYTRVKIKPVEGSNASSIWISGTEIIRLADSNGETSQYRANKVADKINNALLGGAGIYDLRIGDGGNTVVICRKTVVAPTADDSKLAGLSIDALTQSTLDAIKRVLLNERLGQAG